MQKVNNEWCGPPNSSTSFKQRTLQFLLKSSHFTPFGSVHDTNFIILWPENDIAEKIPIVASTIVHCSVSIISLYSFVLSTLLFVGMIGLFASPGTSESTYILYSVSCQNHPVVHHRHTFNSNTDHGLNSNTN